MKKADAEETLLNIGLSKHRLTDQSMLQSYTAANVSADLSVDAVRRDVPGSGSAG